MLAADNVEKNLSMARWDVLTLAVLSARKYVLFWGAVYASPPLLSVEDSQGSLLYRLLLFGVLLNAAMREVASSS